MLAHMPRGVRGCLQPLLRLRTTAPQWIAAVICTCRYCCPLLQRAWAHWRWRTRSFFFPSMDGGPPHCLRGGNSIKDGTRQVDRGNARRGT